MLLNYVMYLVYLVFSLSGLCYLFFCKNIRISKGLLLFILLLFSFFCVCAIITPDWNSYKEMVCDLYKSNGKSVSNMEYIWRRVSVFVEGDIILFRMLIFFPTFFFLYRLVCSLFQKEQYLYFLSLFAVLLLYSVSGGRQILAVLIFYYAIFSSTKKYQFLWLVFSFFCHKIVALLLLQYMVSKIISKNIGKVFVVLLILILLSTDGVNEILNYILHLPLEDYGIDYYEYYLSDEVLSMENLPGARRWIYASYVFMICTVLLILYTVSIVNKKALCFPYDLIYNLLISFLLIFVIMFVVGYTESSKLRFCNVQMLPVILMITNYKIAFKNIIMFVLFVYFMFTNVYITGCL